jgi:iron uptake system EfeUOB component EfeO/EfeM
MRKPRAHRGASRAALVFVLALLGCAVDNRLGADAANALVSGPVRDYAIAQAASAASACLAIEQALAVPVPDLPAGRAAWIDARVAYDRGAAMFFMAAPGVDRVVDGRLDDPLTVTGLRLIERPLFGTPTGSNAELFRMSTSMAAGAVELPAVLTDAGSLNADALLGSMAAIAAVAATKLDGSDSPFAGQSHRSIENNLRGLQVMYGILAPLVESADPRLNEQIRALLASLRAQIEGVPSVDAVPDKLTFLRRCADLSQALLGVGTALGIAVSAPVDVT